MRGARGAEREARFEVVARLAPQLGGRAKASQRGEQLRVLRVLAQPAFGPLDAQARFLLQPVRLGFRQLAVELHQRAVPFGGEAALEQLARERRVVERRRAARCRAGDARMREILGRDAPQAGIQRAAVARAARQQLEMGLHAVLLRDRRRQRAALAEQRRQAQHLLPVLRAAFGAQLHARGGDVPGTGAVQAAQRVARADEIALVQRELGLREQPRRVQRLARGLGAFQPLAAPLVFAHLVRGARGDQRGDAGRRARLPGQRGFLLGAREATFEIALQRGRERPLRVLAPAPLAEGAHLHGQGQRMVDQAQRKVGDRESSRQHQRGK